MGIPQVLTHVASRNPIIEHLVAMVAFDPIFILPVYFEMIPDTRTLESIPRFFANPTVLFSVRSHLM